MRPGRLLQRDVRRWQAGTTGPGHDVTGNPGPDGPGGKNGLGSERGLATPSPDAKGRETSTLSMSIMPREP
jgi:hypothetical protein